MGERVLAFDLGGTRLKAGIVDAAGGTVSGFRAIDVSGDFEEALSVLRRNGEELMEPSVSGVGLCVPGLVDDKGVVVALPGKFPGIEGFDLPGFLESSFSRPQAVVNDAVAYGSGEAAFGAGRVFERVVVVTIGTGVGVTVTEGGVPITRGVFGGGILGGQMPISERASGPSDTSGRPDTIEAHCRAERITGCVTDQGGSFSSIQEIFEAHRAGDDAAIKGIEEYRGHLVRALVALAHAHTPEAIVLGGGPMTDDNPILEGVESRVNERLFGSYRTVIRTAELGDSAALIGLARIVRERMA